MECEINENENENYSFTVVKGTCLNKIHSFTAVFIIWIIFKILRAMCNEQYIAD